MNKKAFSGFGEVLKWIFIIFLIIILIVIIVGPKQLLEKARDALFSFGIIKLPGEETPGFAGKPIPDEIKNYYYGIVSGVEKGINTVKDSEKCKIEIKEKPNLEDYSIALYKNIIKLQIKAKEGLTPAYDPQPISNFAPCLYKCPKNQQCSPSMKDVIINKDLDIAPFLYKPDKNTVCVVAEDAEKSLNNMPKCS